MTDILSNINAFDWVVIVSAGCIALLGIGNSYWLKSGALFAMFCVIIGVQTVLTSVDYPLIELTSPLYSTLAIIYIVMTCVFLVIKSKFLMFSSLAIAVFMLYPFAMALYGVEIPHYEVILGAMWVLQLIGGLSGVLNEDGLLDGIRRSISSIWNHIAYKYHKGA